MGHGIDRKLRVRHVFLNCVMQARRHVGSVRLFAVLQFEGSLYCRLCVSTCADRDLLEGHIAVSHAGDFANQANLLRGIRVRQSHGEVKLFVLVRRYVAHHALGDEESALLARVNDFRDGFNRGDMSCLAGVGDDKSVRRGLGHFVAHANRQAGHVQLLAVLKLECILLVAFRCGIDDVAGLCRSGRTSTDCLDNGNQLIFRCADKILAECDSDCKVSLLIRIGFAMDNLGNLQLAAVAGVGVGGLRGIALRICHRSIDNSAASLESARIYCKGVLRRLEDGVGHLGRHTLDGQLRAAGQGHLGPAMFECHLAGSGVIIISADRTRAAHYGVKFSLQITVERNRVMELPALIRRIRADNRLVKDQVVHFTFVGDCHGDRRFVIRLAGGGINRYAVLLSDDFETSRLVFCQNFRHKVVHVRRQTRQFQGMTGLHEEVCTLVFIEVTSGDGCFDIFTVCGNILHRVACVIRLQIIQYHVELEGSRLVHVQRAVDCLLQNQLAGLAGIDEFSQVSAVHTDCAFVAKLGNGEVGRSVVLRFCYFILRVFGQMLDNQNLAVLQREFVLAVCISDQVFSSFRFNSFAAFDHRVRKSLVGHRHGCCAGAGRYAPQLQREVEVRLLIAGEIGNDFLADNQAGLGTGVGEISAVVAAAGNLTDLTGAGTQHTGDVFFCHHIGEAHRQSGRGDDICVLRFELCVGAGLSVFSDRLERHATIDLAFSAGNSQIRCCAGLGFFVIFTEEFHSEFELPGVVAGLVGVHRLVHVKSANCPCILVAFRKTIHCNHIAIGIGTLAPEQTV